MGLRLSDAHAERTAAIEPELRVAAEAIGMGLREQLVRLAPALTRPPEGAEGEAEATLVALDLDHEGAPDGLSLTACVAAHRSYVTARGRPEAVSAGALALARLLAWAPARGHARPGAAHRVDRPGPAPPRAGGRAADRSRRAAPWRSPAPRAAPPRPP